jgi:hypothetical protein
MNGFAPALWLVIRQTAQSRLPAAALYIQQTRNCALPGCNGRRIMLNSRMRERLHYVRQAGLCRYVNNILWLLRKRFREKRWPQATARTGYTTMRLPFGFKMMLYCDSVVSQSIFLGE